MKTYVDAEKLQEYTTKLVSKLKTLFPTSPLVASTAAGMTDTSRIYVYTGSETGYTAGDWYYYDPTDEEWKDGGIYQSSGIETDTTLAVAGMAADAKATGDAIAAAKAAVLAEIAPTYSSSATYAVGDYVIYNLGLYRCTTAITTAEAWTSGHWTQVDLAADVTDLKNALGETTYNLFTPTLPITSDNSGVIDILANTGITIPAGTYKVVYELSSDRAAGSDCKVVLSKTYATGSSSNIATIAGVNNIEKSAEITINETALSIYAFAGANATQSNGHPVTVKKFMITSQLDADYIPGMTATDFEARKELSELRLLPTGDTTDRTAEIESYLNKYGVCNLAKGTYYTSGIEMPDNTVLRGIGEGSIIRLNNTDGITVKMGDKCTVENVTIEGDDEDIEISGTGNNEIGDTNYLENATYSAGDGYVQYVLSNALPAGNYAVKINGTSNADNNYVRVRLFTTDNYSTDNQITTFTVPKNSSDYVEVDTGDKTIKSLYVTAGDNLSQSSGKTLTISNAELKDIVVSSNRYGIGWTGSDCTSGIVDNCRINRFNGAGILLRDTTQGTNHCLAISNCYIFNNNIGVYIQKNSEFNKICNCTITGNYYGILNRGGNNIVDNCGVDTNVIGIEVDSDEGSNNGHGSITNCTINHSDSNSGYGIIIKNTGRMNISNCNLYYSKLKLDSTNGNLIAHCNFGTSGKVEIVGGGCSVIHACMFATDTVGKITRQNNTLAVVSDCYARNGDVVGETIKDESVIVYRNFKDNSYYDLHGASISIGNPTSNNNYKSIVIPCVEGDTFLPVCYSYGAISRRSAFVDSTGTILSVEAQVPSHDFVINTGETLTAPANSAYFVCNHSKYNYLNETLPYEPVIYKLARSNAINEINRQMGVLPYITTGWKAKVIAIYENLIAYYDNNKVYVSEDYGNSFTNGMDVSGIGAIKSAHFYSDGTLALFTATKAYYTTDYTSTTEAAVYNSDGTTYTPGDAYNFDILEDSAPRKYINGVDMFVFGNYVIPLITSNTRVVIWYSIDRGRSYKIAYEFNLENTFPARHTHQVYYYEPEDTFLALMGDQQEQARVLGMTYDSANDSWSVESLTGSGSRNNKWGYMDVWDGYIYYAHDVVPGAVKRCKFADIGDLSKHETVLGELPNDCVYVAFGPAGDMLVVLSTSISTGSGDREATLSAELAARKMYYSSDRRSFVEIRIPPIVLNSAKMPCWFLPIYNGHLIAQTYWEDYSSKEPTIWLDEIVRNNGYPNAFLPL